MEMKKKIISTELTVMTIVDGETKEQVFDLLGKFTKAKIKKFLKNLGITEYIITKQLEVEKTYVCDIEDFLTISKLVENEKLPE